MKSIEERIENIERILIYKFGSLDVSIIQEDDNTLIPTICRTKGE